MKTWMFAAAAALALAGPPALAQTDARFSATTLDITGHGEAKVPPDMATIELGVVSQGMTAADASHANAEAAAKVIAAIKAGGVDPKDIQTSTLSLSPQYAYGQSSAPRLTGYQATNQVTVTIEDLARLGPIVDAVVSAGATSVSQIQFGLKAPGSAENLARFAAVKQLQEKAAAYADAAGYHVRRLVNISEASSVRAPQPMGVMRMAVAQAAAPTPVETGQVVVSVDITGEFELSHAP